MMVFLAVARGANGRIPRDINIDSYSVYQIRIPIWIVLVMWDRIQRIPTSYICDMSIHIRIGY